MGAEGGGPAARPSIRWHNPAMRGRIVAGLVLVALVAVVAAGPIGLFASSSPSSTASPGAAATSDGSQPSAAGQSPSVGPVRSGSPGGSAEPTPSATPPATPGPIGAVPIVPV